MIAKLQKGTDISMLVPTSEHYADTYKTIRDMFGNGISIIDSAYLARMISIKTGNDITPFQVLRCLDVFSEAGLIKLGRFSADRVCLSLSEVKGKANLQDTVTYKRLNNNA